MKAKPGELRAQWANHPDDGPDVVFAWGAGVPKADAHMLYGYFAVALPYGELSRRNEDVPLLAELDRRGYDLTTLAFSVRKKVRPAPSEGMAQEGEQAQ